VLFNDLMSPKWKVIFALCSGIVTEVMWRRIRSYRSLMNELRTFVWEKAVETYLRRHINILFNLLNKATINLSHLPGPQRILKPGNPYRPIKQEC
jgi:hypothetical protein